MYTNLHGHWLAIFGSFFGPSLKAYTMQRHCNHAFLMLVPLVSVGTLQLEAQKASPRAQVVPSWHLVNRSI